jgi:succinyl-CoA synthetase beta subunit
MIKGIFGLLLFFCFVSLSGQDTARKTYIDVIDGDTVTVVSIDPVEVSAGMDLEKIREYKRLKVRVRKVMPYAKLAAFKMRVMEDNLALKKTKKEKKRYIKQCEESIKQLYMEQLKNMTIDEGKVLVKLIHRELGQTTWQIMKSYRGSTETLFWQAFGAVYGYDLKVEYDPVMDYEIDNIIRIEKLE